MFENFKDFVENEETYNLASDYCDFMSQYDTSSWFERTGHFTVTDEDVEDVIGRLNGPEDAVGFIEELETIRELDSDALSSSDKTIIENLIVKLKSLFLFS